jgi:SRSO17 transposase
MTLEPRAVVPKITFADEYCPRYTHLFPEVRAFGKFKYLHMGMISDIKHKSLPAIAKVQSLEELRNLPDRLLN